MSRLYGQTTVRSDEFASAIDEADLGFYEKSAISIIVGNLLLPGTGLCRHDPGEDLFGNQAIEDCDKLVMTMQQGSSCTSDVRERLHAINKIVQKTERMLDNGSIHQKVKRIKTVRARKFLRLVNNVKSFLKTRKVDVVDCDTISVYLGDVTITFEEGSLPLFNDEIKLRDAEYIVGMCSSTAVFQYSGVYTSVKDPEYHSKLIRQIKYTNNRLSIPLGLTLYEIDSILRKAIKEQLRHTINQLAECHKDSFGQIVRKCRSCGKEVHYTQLTESKCHHDIYCRDCIHEEGWCPHCYNQCPVCDRVITESMRASRAFTRRDDGELILKRVCCDCLQALFDQRKELGKCHKCGSDDDVQLIITSDNIRAYLCKDCDMARKTGVSHGCISIPDASGIPRTLTYLLEGVNDSSN